MPLLMRTWILILLPLLLFGCRKEQETDYIEEITESEQGFAMRMEMRVGPSRDEVYGILTDFRHFPDFMPQCTSVEILKEDGNTVVIETRRFVKFLGKKLAGRLEYVLHPDRILVRSLNHPLAEFQEEWLLKPSGGSTGTRVIYSAQSKMKVPMPDYMCQAWLRDNFKETLAAVEARAGSLREQERSQGRP